MLAVFTVWAISMLSFVIIQLPPGDYVNTYIAQMSASGAFVSAEEAETLRAQYGLDQPVYVQYLRWMGLIVRGNFGMAMEYELPGLRGHRRPALAHHGGLDRRADLHLDGGAADRHLLGGAPVLDPRLRLHLHRLHRPGVPSFLLALLVLYFGFKYFNANIGGLFSRRSPTRPGAGPSSWTCSGTCRIPAIVLGMAATARPIRIMRANLLDEKRKPYVVSARARACPRSGHPEVPGARGAESVRQHHRLHLPYVVSGSVIVSIVLSLPTVGPLLLQGADRAGHVPGRHDHPDARRADRDRHVAVGPPADVARPAHPAGSGR